MAYRDVITAMKRTIATADADPAGFNDSISCASGDDQLNESYRGARCRLLIGQLRDTSFKARESAVANWIAEPDLPVLRVFSEQ